MVLKKDLPSALVVYLVALPLCLGIALASGVPMFSGIIAGVVGGIVVGSFSGSHVSVSGPAAGLTSIVFFAIQDLGSFPLFLSAVMAAGVIQYILGTLKAGVIGYFFPNSVIKGMLAAIGLILILKQIPHAIGYDADFEGDLGFAQANDENTLTSIMHSLRLISPAALIISTLCLLILYIFESQKKKGKITFFKLVPGPLVAVLFGVGLNQFFESFVPSLGLGGDHLVSLPVPENFEEFKGYLSRPEMPDFSNGTWWLIAFTIALVASLESLLSIEASDKLDPQKRITPASRELRAQGIGNVVSGFLGGLPVTSVIVRSSANATSGSATRFSTIMHGIFLLLTVVLIPTYLNLIPLACLAAVLLQVGYKLTRPSLYTEAYKKGWSQLIPFVITILAILFTDLLIGISVGIVVGLAFVMVSNFKSAIISEDDGEGELKISFKKDVSFLNKATLLSQLSKVPQGYTVWIDGSQAQWIDNDIKEIVKEFQSSATDKDLIVKTTGIKL